MSRFRLGFAFAVVVAVGASPAWAQPHTLFVTQNGAPVENVELFIIVNAEKPKLDLSRTDAKGSCEIPVDTLTKLNVPTTTGTAFRAWRRVCADGKIQVILVAPGVSVTRDQLGCGRKEASAGESCECHDMGFVVLGPTMRLALPSPTGGMGMGMGMPGRPFRLTSTHAMGALKITSFGSGTQPCVTTELQLVDLGYNQNTDGCTTDSSGIGWLAGGAVTLDLGNSTNVDLWVGFQLEHLGEESHGITGAGRIGDFTRPSNLIFTYRSTTSKTLANIEIGAAIATRRATIVPYLAIGRASITNVVTQTLLGGPPSTVPPTVQVSGGTNETSNAKWGPGFGARVLVPLTGRIGLLVQVQRRPFGDAFPADNEGRYPTAFSSTGVAIGACVDMGGVIR